MGNMLSRSQTTNMSQEQEQKQTQEMEDPTIDEQLMEAVNTEPPAKKQRKRKPKVTVQTSDPNIEVELRSRQPGPEKQRVVVYKEDLPPKQITIVEKSKKRGRPQEKVEVQRDIEMDEDSLVIPRPKITIQPTQKQLIQMEKYREFCKMEQAIGRKLRQTTKGGVDKRCVMDRTPAQIASAKAMVERNAARKAARLEEERLKQADQVKTVIGELAKAHVPPTQKRDPFAAY